jgi:nucleoside-diphosphate-sugar epimerase
MDRAASPGDMFRINTVSTLDLLQYGKEAGISKFIYLSSGAVYGYAEDQLAEDGRLNPAEFYGLTKYESEFLVQHYRQFFSTSIVRLFFPYGENQRRGLVPRLHECILQRKAITIFNDGNPRINPVYIADVVMAIKYLLGDPEHGIFNLCGDDVVTIKELAAIIAESLDVEPLFTHTLDESVGDLVGCNGLIKQKLQCDALTPLRSGIARFLGNRANTAG